MVEEKDPAQEKDSGMENDMVGEKEPTGKMDMVEEKDVVGAEARGRQWGDLLHRELRVFPRWWPWGTNHRIVTETEF
jgi:hypothetical protein